MTSISYTLVTSVNQSPEFFQFEPKHFAYTNKDIVSINSKSLNDFEVNIISQDDDNGAVTDFTLPEIFQNSVMAVIDLIFVKSMNGTLSINKDTTETEFEDAFSDLTITFSSLFEDTTGNIWPTDVTISNGTNTLTAYMYPSEFVKMYSGSEVEVIPLLSNVDTFGTVDAVDVRGAIADLEAIPFAEEFSEISTKHPCTKVSLLEHKWVNQHNQSEVVNVPFGIVQYGYPSEEVIDQAIRDHIDNHSTLTKSAKETIFPTLYGSYGYTIFPIWDKLAFDDDRPTYSPIFRPDNMLEYIKTVVHLCGDSHLLNTWELLPTQYQSVNCFMVPDEDNYDDIGTLSENLPRYFNVAPSHPEFVKLGPDTRVFVTRLFDALIIAESFPESAPNSIVEIEQVNGLTYATFFSGGLRWRVLTKSSYIGGLK